MAERSLSVGLDGAGAENKITFATNQNNSGC